MWITRERKTDPLKVQIVSTYYAPETTGNAPYVTSLARGLAQRGHEVSVLAGAPHYPGWEILPRSEWREEEIVDRVHVRRIASFVPKRPNFASRLLYEAGYGAKFASRARSDADVTILVSPNLFASAVVRAKMATSRRRRPPTLLWIQDLYSQGVGETPGTAARLMGGAMRAIEGGLARRCSKVVVIHDRFRRVLVERLNVEPRQVATVRNWTHVPTAGVVDVPEVRDKWGWVSPDEVVVLHAGNMGAKQGLENVIRAARYAEANGLPVRFVLMGDGNQRAQLTASAAGCARVQFIAPLPEREFLEALRAADVLLVNERPTLNEAAVPSKLTTYFTTGRPVLAATAEDSTTADEIRASHAGAIVPPDDPKALADTALALSQAWSEADAAAGPAFVHRHLSSESALSAFDDLLREIAANDSATSVASLGRKT
ncbi:hypothetical protein LQK93_02865 [Terrabacter sp. BE26]